MLDFTCAYELYKNNNQNCAFAYIAILLDKAENVTLKIGQTSLKPTQRIKHYLYDNKEKYLNGYILKEFLCPSKNISVGLESLMRYLLIDEMPKHFVNMDRFSNPPATSFDESQIFLNYLQKHHITCFDYDNGSITNY